MTSNKKRKREQNFSIEELYQNKNFISPKEQNLETIFEEPRQAKSGAPILTSVRKYRRYLDFDPTQGKKRKRKMKTKNCFQKFNIKRSKTRSETKACSQDINVILEALNDSSDESLDEVTMKNDKEKAAENTEKAELVTDLIKDKCELMEQKYVSKTCQTEISCILICENCKLLQKICACQSSQNCADTENNEVCKHGCSGENKLIYHDIENANFNKDIVLTHCNQFTQTDNSSVTDVQAKEDEISPSNKPCIVA